MGYIERYVPELLPKLFPVQSPMMCAAIYVRKVMGIQDKLAFISPCIAKKNEIESKRGKGYISYNVTFDHLMKYVREHNISGPSCKDEIEYGLGSVYPIPGGLKENVYWFLGEDAFIRQCEGEKHMYHYLEDNKKRLAKGDTPYLFVDALNCAQGCLYGTGTESAKNATDDVLMEMLRIKKASKNNDFRDTWSRKLSPEKRLQLLNKQFAKLNLEDYLCDYTDFSKMCESNQPTASQLEQIYTDMNKTTAASRVINCSCCGYESCEQMATAIFNGFNHKENCIHYVKNQIELQKEEAVQLVNEIEEEKNVIANQQEKILQATTEINARFDNVYRVIDDMAKGNEQTASDCTEISQQMTAVSEFCQELNRSTQNINSLIESLILNNNEVMSVAEETNLLALNASIEAARAGEAGRGFAVVASEINALASSSHETADKSNKLQSDILSAVQSIQTNADKLSEIIQELNGEAENLAAVSQEIATSNDMILEETGAVKKRLNELTEN